MSPAEIIHCTQALLDSILAGETIHEKNMIRICDGRPPYSGGEDWVGSPDYQGMSSGLPYYEDNKVNCPECIAIMKKHGL